jgi:hypothetical protein
LRLCRVSISRTGCSVYFVGEIGSQQWNPPVDYFFAPAAESKSSSVAAAIEVKSIVRMAAPKSLVAIQYAKPAAVIDKVGKAVLNRLNVCVFFVFANKL